MKLILTISCMLLGGVVSAQDDSVVTEWLKIHGPIPYHVGATDDSTMVPYGARLYDPRMGRYLPADPAYSKQSNPYGMPTVAVRRKVVKKPVKKTEQ